MKYLLILFIVGCYGEKNEETGYLDNFNEGIYNVDNYHDRNEGKGDAVLFNVNKDRIIYDDKRRNYFEFDAGNPDIHGEIQRPCQAYDTFCIRKYFEDHSQCKASGRRLPEPFYRAQTTLNYASANISAIPLDVSYTGLSSGRVAEFYVNKKTDNLIIAFSFEVITISTKNINLKFHLRGREPIVTRGSGALALLQPIVTFVIPGLKDLRLERAEIYTYGDNPLPPFVLSPGTAETTDPEVLAMYAFLATANVPRELLEELSTEGVFFGTNFLQYNICDFGLKVI